LLSNDIFTVTLLLGHSDSARIISILLALPKSKRLVDGMSRPDKKNQHSVRGTGKSRRAWL